MLGMRSRLAAKAAARAQAMAPSGCTARVCSGRRGGLVKGSRIISFRGTAAEAIPWGRNLAATRTQSKPDRLRIDRGAPPKNGDAPK
jgi:hypothetical protein